ARSTLWSEIVAGEMEEHRRREADRVDAIQNAAVSFDDAAEILDPAIALDRGHDEPAREAHQANDEGHAGSLGWSERSDPPHGRANGGCRSDAAEKARPRFVGAYIGSDLALAEGLAPDVLQDVANLHHEDEEEEELGVFARVTGDLQLEQRGRVAEAVNANHQRPL